MLAGAAWAGTRSPDAGTTDPIARRLANSCGACRHVIVFELVAAVRSAGDDPRTAHGLVLAVASVRGSGMGYAVWYSVLRGSPEFSRGSSDVAAADRRMGGLLCSASR